MIRVLHVIGSLNSGGSQTMIMNLYRNIDRSKIQFDFIIDRENELFYAEEIKKLGGKIHVLPTFNIKNILIYRKSWKSFFYNNPEYKIIHGHVRSTAAIYLKIAKKYGLKTISHSHSTSSGSGISALVKNILQYRIRYIADYLFACSKESGEWLFGKKSLNNKNFFILNNSIDAKKFIYDEKTRESVRKELNIDNKFVVGHIGRFHPSKNHEFILDVFKEISNKSKESVLILVGDGELKESIKNKVKELGLQNNVIFTGVRSDIERILQGLDIFIFPSIYEGLGIVAVESQAAGLRTIVSNSIPKEAFVTDLIEMVSLESPKSDWVDTIMKYTNGYERNNTYEQICNKGYDINETVKWLEKFYLERLKNND